MINRTTFSNVPIFSPLAAFSNLINFPNEPSLQPILNFVLITNLFGFSDKYSQHTSYNFSLFSLLCIAFGFYM